MNLPSVKLSKEEQKEKILKSQADNEKKFKLVVKIINWKTGLKNGASTQPDDKITSYEWQCYKQHLVEISKANPDKVKGKLEETYEAIKLHGGFE